MIPQLIQIQKMYPGFRLGAFSSFLLGTILNILFGCGSDQPVLPVDDTSMDDPIETVDNDLVEGVDYFLSDIDLSNWKVTLPIPRTDGKPIEVEPPEILDYPINKTLLPLMYNDSTDGSLAFYSYPESSTANSSYSRTELREQMDPGSNSTNWTFAQGGKMKGTLSVPEMTKDEYGNYHRAIIMQIHGRLTDEQKILIGANDNNAPPVLKIYWTDGKVRVKTKILKDLESDNKTILKTDAWGDDEGRNFAEEVGHEKFTLEVVVSKGKMEVILNEKETFVYDDIHMEKWGVFENYFKAGNYLVTLDKNARAIVKYYDLKVSH